MQGYRLTISPPPAGGSATRPTITAAADSEGRQWRVEALGLSCCRARCPGAVLQRYQQACGQCMAGRPCRLPAHRPAGDTVDAADASEAVDVLLLPAGTLLRVVPPRADAAVRVVRSITGACTRPPLYMLQYMLHGCRCDPLCRGLSAI